MPKADPGPTLTLLAMTRGNEGRFAGDLGAEALHGTSAECRQQPDRVKTLVPGGKDKFAQH